MIDGLTCYNWAPGNEATRGEQALKNDRAMNDFLQGVERRALKMAELATGNRDDAMEIVQDTMLGLVRRYADRPDQEWKPLFYRILQSRINDFHRRRAVRQKVMALMPTGAEGSDEDPIEQAPAGEQVEPVATLQRELANESMLAAIAALPGRQQQAFMLRAWEGMSVADTAIAMRCSDGSVKTHYSRAVKALQAALASLFDSDATA
ncbi:MAG: RNA polymerase sigma factor [Pseudomonadota bacterium]